MNIVQTSTIVWHVQNLSSLTIKLPEENVKQFGVYYTILKTIAWEGINFTEAVSTANEVTIILKNEDVNRAFQALQVLFQK